MARARPPEPKPVLGARLGELRGLIDRFGADQADLDLRTKVRRLVDIHRSSKEVWISAVAEGGITGASARDRLREYFLRYPRTVLDGEELEIVSGISEYARRIRELRVEEGFAIVSGAGSDPETGIDLRPEQYMLVESDPDGDAARRWESANRIRRLPGGAQGRILTYLLENVGKKVTTEELAYVCRDAHEFGRRTRELRTEHGYAISTRLTGRPDLAPGQYVLESAERVAEEHDRHIPEAVRREVYERDGNACRLCGWSRATALPGDSRILEVHHIVEHAARGPNIAANLAVLCGHCHDDVHAGRLDPGVLRNPG